MSADPVDYFNLPVSHELDDTCPKCGSKGTGERVKCQGGFEKVVLICQGEGCGITYRMYQY